MEVCSKLMEQTIELYFSLLIDSIISEVTALTFTLHVVALKEHSVTYHNVLMRSYPIVCEKKTAVCWLFNFFTFSIFYFGTASLLQIMIYLVIVQKPNKKEICQLSIFTKDYFKFSPIYLGKKRGFIAAELKGIL